MLIGKIKSVLVNSLLLIISTSFILLVSEFLIRQILEPIDYSRPSAKKDEILGHKIEPYSGSHDAWGLRNRFIPKQVDIVAIGDSFTYGQGVPRYSSWPAVLERESHTPVYNMGMGGYGTVEYFYLLKTKALLLNPKQIIVAVYLGNDLMDTFNAVYSRPYWSQFRNLDLNYSETDRSQFVFYDRLEKSRRLFSQLRVWLYRHSVLYNVFKAIFAEKIAQLKFQQNKSENHLTVFEDAYLRLTFSPQHYLALLNLEDERIREGIRISLQMLLKMSKLCKENQVSFGVVLIPTKVNIYAEHLQSQSHIAPATIINKLIAHENQVIKIFQAFLKKNNINYINLGIELKPIKDKYTLYPAHDDAHFNSEGHVVIGQILARWLRKQKY